MNTSRKELNNNQVNNNSKKVYNPIARGSLSIAILCPVCGEVLNDQMGINSCPNCGQELDFSEIIGLDE